MNKKEALTALIKNLEEYLQQRAAFFERAGKKVSDYTQWKKVLANRYREM